MAAYAARVGKALDLKDCRVAHAMQEDGLYLHKRPVRGAGSAANILSQAGSIFHHIVLFVKTPQGLTALEMGPRGDADVASNIFEAVEAGPIVCHAAEPPADGAPLLHIAAPHHTLTDPAVQKAIEFASAQQYHTVHSNCIQFADFAVRLLTGGAVMGAPLAYDVLCGSVPPADSPLLGMLAMLQMTWLDVVDGSRLMTQFLAQHSPPPALAPVPPLPSFPTDNSKSSDSIASRPALPARAAPASSNITASSGQSANGLPDFLAAALSAADSGSGSSSNGSGGQTGPDSSNPLRGSGAAPQGGLPDLLSSVLVAACSGQQGAAPADGGNSSGIAGLLSAALAGGLQEAGKGSGSGPSSAAANGNGGMPALPVRKRRPA